MNAKEIGDVQNIMLEENEIDIMVRETANETVPGGLGEKLMLLNSKLCKTKQKVS
jgi:hypothetical protein